MDSRLERKNYRIAEDNESRMGSIKDKNNVEDIFTTKYLKRQTSKDYKVYDRNAMEAMFKKEVSIPRSRKTSLLKDIKEFAVPRQMDTPEAIIKKKRKKLDVKKVQEVKKKDSKSTIIISKKDSVADEELMYKARTRLQQNYEQIKRILHDHDDFLTYLEEEDRANAEERLSTINMLTLKSAKIPVADQIKTIGSLSYNAKRVGMDDTVSDGCLTNDIYDYTKAKQTERQFLDIALDRASWADRRNESVRSSINSRGYRVSMIEGPRTSRETNTRTRESRGITLVPALQHSSNKLASPSQIQMQMFGAIGKRYSHGIRLSQVEVKDKEQDGMLFPGADDDLQGISPVSRKTIQYMNSKNVAKIDSQSALNNMDSYIWYLINPIAKRKYDLFLQKTKMAPLDPSVSSVVFSNAKLQRRGN